MATTKVRLTEFGKARHESRLNGGTATLEDLFEKHGVEAAGRRVAVNGHPAGPGTTVVEGDEISVLPRVQGG